MLILAKQSPGQVFWSSSKDYNKDGNCVILALVQGSHSWQTTRCEAVSSVICQNCKRHTNPNV